MESLVEVTMEVFELNFLLALTCETVFSLYSKFCCHHCKMPHFTKQNLKMLIYSPMSISIKASHNISCVTHFYRLMYG